jgi:hypothetical protein
VTAPVGSCLWQAKLLGVTLLGGAMGIAGLLGALFGRPPWWAREDPP